MLNRGGGSFGGGAGGGGTPGGSSGDIQYNNAGALGGLSPTDDRILIGNGTSWELKALAAGIVSYNTTGNAVAGRTITGTTNEITVTNGDGISGNPTLSLVVGTVQLTRPGGVSTTITGWPSQSYYGVEDWITAGAVCTTASRPCGSGGFTWWLTGTNSVMTTIANETAHPGNRVVRSGASANNQSELQTTAASGSLTWDNTFDMIWVVKGVQTSTATRQAFGLTSDAGIDPLVTGTFFRKKHSGDAGGADTNWMFVCGDGTANNVDTTVAHGTGWFTMRLARVNSTTIGWAICSGEGCALPALTNVTTNCPTGTGEARPSVQVETAEAVLKDLAIDYVDLIVTGLTARD